MWAGRVGEATFRPVPPLPPVPACRIFPGVVGSRVSFLLSPRKMIREPGVAFWDRRGDGAQRKKRDHSSMRFPRAEERKPR
jgi:hypothetical protein